MNYFYPFFICLLSFSPGMVWAQNLVLNPGFEDHSNEDVRDPNGDWKLNKIEWEKVGAGAAHGIEDIGVSGSTAFIFKKDNSAQQQNDITLRQDIAITEGKLYQFSFYAKMEQNAGNLLRFSIVKIKNGQPVNVNYWGPDTLYMPEFESWNMHRGLFEIPAGTNTDTIRIVFFRGPGGDSCLVDNITIQERENDTYYVSSSAGDDSNDGTSPDEAWATLSKISTSKFVSGDTILFKANEEFIGQLFVPSSGTKDEPIVFSSYGSGSKPILNGSGDPEGDHEFVVFIENQEGIVLENLEIQNNRKAPRANAKDTRSYGILIRVNQPVSKEYFRMKNLTIKNIYPIHLDNVSFYDVEVAGIHVFTTVNYPDKAKHIKDIIIEDCDISRSAKFGIWTVHGLAINDTVGNDTINRNQDIVIRNNHIYENGGSGITISKAYNCLIEHNVIAYSGASSFDHRMVGRGSSIWFFNSINGISQYNNLTHVRGEIDSYSQHIDYSNRNIFMQFNYSENNEGGFIQILGDNVNSIYRYNISVNDGWRNTTHIGRTIALTDFVENKPKRSDSTYIYGNTVFINEPFSTQILLDGFSTFVFNNIFCTEGDGEIGGSTEVTERSLEYMHISNNLYFGNASLGLQNLDNNKVLGSPHFVGPNRNEPDNFKLTDISGAAYMGTTFIEPKFSLAGIGIFKDVTSYPKYDFFYNPINVKKDVPHIGAHAGGDDFMPPPAGPVSEVTLKGNPVTSGILVDLPSWYLDQELTVQIIGLNGRLIQQEQMVVPTGYSLSFTPRKGILNGMYLLVIRGQNNSDTTPFLLIR